MEILKVENLIKVYGKDESQVVALDNVSFSVEKGEFVAIVGASGSGKSTLLHIIGGVDRPTSGKVYIDEKDIFDLNDDELAIFRRRQVGLIYQFYNLIPILNVAENISLPLSLDNRKVDENDLNKMLKLLGLENRREHLPNELSGGQQQRVAIARTLIMNPDIIMFDEPMSALDVATRLSLRKEIKRIQAEFKTTMIYITHDQEEAFAMSDRIMVMKEARLVQIDTPQNIISNPADDYVKDFVLSNLQAKIDSLLKYVKV